VELVTLTGAMLDGLLRHRVLKFEEGEGIEQTTLPRCALLALQLRQMVLG